MVRRIDNVGTTVWTAYFGDSHATAGKVSNSVGLSIVQVRIYVYYHWRPTKVETTGATLNYKTLISRLFETFLDFETKKQVVPRHAGTP